MKLDRPFIQLPFRYDVQRLVAEAEQFALSDWRSHPQKYNGNSALRLITRDGEDNDDARGSMKPTELLLQCPYIQQIIQSFGVVVSRSRLMKLAPRSVVPEHSDTNYHWFNKVRIHIPVTTNPNVLFYCDNEVVHMQAGEAWIFDNWRRHKVENDSDRERIHLVIDTVGSARFWQMVKFVSTLPATELARQTSLLNYRYADHYELITEVDSHTCIVSPYELTLLCQDFHQEICCPDKEPDAEHALAFFKHVVNSLCEDWHSLYAQHGPNQAAAPLFRDLLERARASFNSIPANVAMRSNGIPAKNVFVARVIQGAVREPLVSQPRTAPLAKVRRAALANTFERPVFIVSAPRSGSTLLFETLAKNETLMSIGGESHEIFEGIAGFNPAKGTVPDNRLTAAHLNDEVSVKILSAFHGLLKNADGFHEVPKAGKGIRLLEKTPKNSLRIPFINALFPDALFIYLYREPKENIASIIEAWRSGRWVTYPGLPGRGKPWSLLLPPGWQQFNSAAIEETAAFQWCAANQQIMTDLSALDPRRVACVGYQELVHAPADTVAGLCRFIDVPMGQGLEKYLADPLPHSRYTLQAPEKDKWKKHEAALDRLAAVFSPVDQQLLAWKREFSGV